jgi:co-chaperonin GroES (HSP10)
MKPIGKYIVVANIKEEVFTQSGIALSREDVEELRYQKAEVIASGTDVSTVEAKDVIFYDKRQAYSMMLDGTPCTIIQERDVVVVV